MKYEDYEKFCVNEMKKGKSREEVIDYLVELDCKRVVAEEIYNRTVVEKNFGIEKQKRKWVRNRDEEYEMDY
ncbi:MAG: hypothetical protein IKV70_02490 [Phascolarctobacterium sp.]|nr:hypothetical protein [Phascolarctobacterium sp.]